MATDASPPDSFASKEIGPDGGTLVLPNYDISMFIPCWALKENETITMQLLTNPSQLNVGKGDAVGSPGIVCHPSGTKFGTPIRVVFPHCFRFAHSSSASVTLFCKSEDDEGTREPLPCGGDLAVAPRCVVRRDTLELFVSHFSILQLILAEISHYIFGKRMAITPYLPRSMSRSQPQLCHIRLYNDTPGMEKIIEDEESNLGYVKVAPTQKIYVKWDDEAFFIQCQATNAELETNARTIDLADIYRFDRCTAYFLITPTVPPSGQVLVRVGFEPRSSEGHTFIMAFQDDVLALERTKNSVGTSRLESPQTENSASNIIVAGDVTFVIPNVAELSSPGLVSQPTVVPHPLRHELGVRLNAEDALLHNWIGLACTLGMDEYVESFRQCPKPAEEVFRIAEQQQKLKELPDLRTLLVKMERFDCVEIIDKYLQENAAQDKETGDTKMPTKEEKIDDKPEHDLETVKEPEEEASCSYWKREL